MGRVAKGVKCSVMRCTKQAIRSISTNRANVAGLDVGEMRKTYLCRDHYKDFRRNPAVKKQRMLDRWRFRG
jgi:hypothetical protein